MVAVSEFFGSPTTDSVPFCKCITLLVRSCFGGRWRGSWVTSEGREFYLLGCRGAYDAVNVNTREVDFVRIQSTAGYDFLGLYAGLEASGDTIYAHTSTKVSAAFLAMEAEKLFAVYLGGRFRTWRGKQDDIIPEHGITHLINLPSVNKGNITLESRFQEVSTSVDLPGLLLVSLDEYAIFETATVVANGYGTELDRCGSTCRGKKVGYTCGMSANAFNKGSLGDQFKRYFAFQVHGLEEFVSVGMLGLRFYNGYT